MKLQNSVLALAGAIFLFQAGGGISFAEDCDARLSSFEGTVDVLPQGETDTWREAEAEMPLATGDKVRTGGASSAEITLDGGGVIRLGADSAADISSLDPAASSFFLRFGSLVAKIEKELRKRGARLQVRTPAAVCAVRGTEFGVEHDQESGETAAGVFDEGSLAVASTDKDGKTVAEEMVEKGSEVRLRAGERAFKPGAMKRLLRHRQGLEAARGRLDILRKSWKRLPPEKRLELRNRFIARKAFRKNRAGKVRALRQRRADRADADGAAGKPGKSLQGPRKKIRGKAQGR